MARKQSNRKLPADRPLPATDDGFVMFYQLAPGLGIPYSRLQIRNLVKQGSFPAPFQLNGTAPGGRVCWRLGDLKEWLRSRPRAFSMQDEGAANA